jgi:hypothetical protein
MRLMQLLRLLVPILAIGFTTVAPAFAGSAETALLASFAGDWRGKGKVTGPDPGTVVCRLSFNIGKSGTLSYTGRCSFGVGQTSFRGAIFYNDARGRFEASSDAQGVSTTAVGKKSGGGVVFSSSGVDTRYGLATSTMSLTGKAIKLSFKLVDTKGATTASNITFSKS